MPDAPPLAAAPARAPGIAGQPTLWWFGSLLIAAAWWVPFHFPPWTAFQAEALAGAGLLCLAVAWALQNKLDWPHPTAAVRVGLIALPLLPWLQAALLPDAYWGDLVIGSWCTAVAVLAVWIGFGVRRGTTPIDLAPLWLGLWAGAMVSALLGAAQIVGIADQLPGWVFPSGPGGKMLGNVAQPNQLAILLLMGCVAGWALDGHWPRWRSLWVFGTAVLTLALVLAQSRAGLLSAVVLAAYLATRPAGSAPRRAVLLGWLAAIAMGTALLPALYSWLDWAGARGDLTRSSDRIAMWRQILAGANAQPWLGHGWNQTPRAQLIGADAHFLGVPTDYAHNLFLDLVAWMGWPIGIALSLLLAAWVVQCVRRVHTPHAVLAVAACVPVVVGSMVEHPFAYLYILLPAALLAGYASGDWMATSPRPANRAGALLAISVLAAVGAWCAVEYLQLEDDYRAARFAGVWNVQEAPGRVPSTIRLLTHLHAQGEAVRAVPRGTLEPGARANLDRAAQRFASAPLGFNQMAALLREGRRDEANRQFRRMLNVHGWETAVYMRNRLAMFGLDPNAIELPATRPQPVS